MGQETWGKSVKGFMSYDKTTNKLQTDLLLNIFRCAFRDL